MSKHKTILFLILLPLFFFVIQGSTAYAAEPIIVVIDPGHGGDNLGAQYNAHTEKDMTLIVANAMKEALEQYENITVYLTHDTDCSMSIKDRVSFAKEKQADFLFCLHFNMSIHHELYGSEVWVSAFGEEYVKGRQFAEIAMDQFEEMGLFHRGIKTRLNDEGTNYYGILRYSSEQSVNTVLIEHCHLDNKHDKPFYTGGTSDLERFGEMDAEAAAKYLGLVSKDGTKDYSNYPKKEISMVSIVKPDTTEPEACSIELLSTDQEQHTADIKITAHDKDSYIQYYAISTDQGQTYSELYPWPRKVWYESKEEVTHTVDLPTYRDTKLQVVVYNGYDLKTESNMLPILSKSKPSEEKTPSFQKENEGLEADRNTSKADYQQIFFDSGKESLTQDQLVLIVLISCLCLIAVLIFIIMLRLLIRLLKGNRRKK